MFSGFPAEGKVEALGVQCATGLCDEPACPGCTVLCLRPNVSWE